MSVYLKQQINEEFIKGISLFLSNIIVHTHLAKNILTSDLGVDSAKVRVILIGIPQRNPKIERQRRLGFSGDGQISGFRPFLAGNYHFSRIGSEGLRNTKIFELGLARYMQEEIAGMMEVDKKWSITLFQKKRQIFQNQRR